MAGPSVVVRILGDLKQLSGSMTDAGAKAEGGASRAHAAFSNMLGMLNRSGVLGPFAGALDAVDSTLGALAEHSKGVGQTMMGLGGGVLALGATLSAFGSKEKASHQQLQAAIDATGKSYDDYAGNIEKAIKKQEGYGHASAETQDALRQLTQATHDPQKALDLLGTASNVAASKHESLSAAAGQLGKVYNGNTRLLKEFGVVVDKNTKQTSDGKTAMQALADVTAGQASAATDTFAGKLNAVKTKLEDNLSMIGQKYGPALQAAGVAVMTLGSIWEVVGPMIAAGEMSAFWPILLIVGAIAALGIAAYVIYRNWDTIWKGMKAAVEFVWNWIKANWPLLLGILFGPVGLAIAFILQHFDKVKQVASEVVDHVRSAFQGLVGFFQRLGHDMFDPLEHAFKDVVDAIARAWNNTIGSLHFDVPSWVPGVGGHGFSAPKIPTLAQGGLITQTGFVYAHAGEAISPIPSGVGGVTIENVNVSNNMDIDSFTRRLAWSMATSGVAS